MILERDSARDVHRDDIDADVAADARFFDAFDRLLVFLRGSRGPATLSVGMARIEAERRPILPMVCLVIISILVGLVEIAAIAAGAPYEPKKGRENSFLCPSSFARTACVGVGSVASPLSYLAP